MKTDLSKYIGKAFFVNKEIREIIKNWGFKKLRVGTYIHITRFVKSSQEDNPALGFGGKAVAIDEVSENSLFYGKDLERELKKQIDKIRLEIE